MKKVVLFLFAIGGIVALWLFMGREYCLSIPNNQRVVLQAEGIGVTYAQAVQAAKERILLKADAQGLSLASTWPTRIEKKTKRVWLKKKIRRHWRRRRVRVVFFLVKVKGSFLKGTEKRG